jgi:hypothetical protein
MQEQTTFNDLPGMVSQILNKVERLGDKSAGYIYDGLRNASDFIDALLKHISIDAPAEQQSQKYAGLAIAVTGSGSINGIGTAMIISVIITILQSLLMTLPIFK